MKFLCLNVDIKSFVFAFQSHRQTLSERLCFLDQINGQSIISLECKITSNNIDDTGAARDG